MDSVDPSKFTCFPTHQALIYDPFIPVTHGMPVNGSGYGSHFYYEPLGLQALIQQVPSQEVTETSGAGEAGPEDKPPARRAPNKGKVKAPTSKTLCTQNGFSPAEKTKTDTLNEPYTNQGDEEGLIKSPGAESPSGAGKIPQPCKKKPKQNGKLAPENVPVRRGRRN